MKEIIQKILEIAVYAPSGHNFQPWSFAIENNGVRIFNIPKGDTTIYNFEQRGSFMAHGALIENILIASLEEGYKANVSLFPNQSNPNLVATVTFEKSERENNPLYAFIKARTTNRKPYHNIPLRTEHRNELLETGNEIGGAKVLLVEDIKKKEILARAFTLNEQFLFENYNVHQSLFPHLLWNKKDVEQKKIGLYIKTLELPPPAKVIFKLIKHWPIARFFGTIGFSKVVAAQNQKLYSAASALGLIAVSGNSNRDFVIAGRLMQKIWLKATRMGLSLQPVTAVLYFGHRVLAGDTEKFSPEQTIRIKDAYETIRNLFNMKTETMAMTFRLGYGGIPSASSSKLFPQF